MCHDFLGLFFIVTMQYDVILFIRLFSNWYTSQDEICINLFSLFINSAVPSMATRSSSQFKLISINFVDTSAKYVAVVLQNSITSSFPFKILSPTMFHSISSARKLYANLKLPPEIYGLMLY